MHMLWLRSAAVHEHLLHDLGSLKEPIAWGAYHFGRLLTCASSEGLQARGFKLLMRLHTSGFSQRVERSVERRIREANNRGQRGEASGLERLYEQSIDNAVTGFFKGRNPIPARLIGSRLLVTKRSRRSERGVVVVDYSYVFPLLAGLFDLSSIAERYTIVLEPSWMGACTPEILLYTRLKDTPVFVETIEPHDQQLIANLQSNLEVVPTAANFWVDYRTTPPQRVAERDIDVIMVASWSAIKRHWRFFKVLGDLRKRGHRLNVALVGYQYDLTRNDIEAQARYFGVADQVRTYERLSQPEVAALLSRSKVHVLWSRRECANRAIVEAMLADVPVLVREGLTYGYNYPYINPQTGRFVREDELGDAILETIATPARYAPRQWVLENMTSQRATAIMEETLRTHALQRGEPWTEGLTVRTSMLDRQEYWDPNDRARFESDYQFLESAIRPR